MGGSGAGGWSGDGRLKRRMLMNFFSCLEDFSAKGDALDFVGKKN